MLVMGKKVPAKNEMAVAMAKLRAKSMTPARRKEIAQAAAAARWGKIKGAKTK